MKKLLINLEILVNEKYEVTAVKLLNQAEAKSETEQKNHITLLDTKLSFNQEAVKLLGAEIGDRIFLYYMVNSDTDLIPVITHSNNTTNASQGNILKKDNSIIFKGRPRTVLSSHGVEFSLVSIDGTYENSYQLVPVVQDVNPEPTFDQIIGVVPVV